MCKTLDPSVNFCKIKFNYFDIYAEKPDYSATLDKDQTDLLFSPLPEICDTTAFTNKK